MSQIINREYILVTALALLTLIGITFQFYYGFSWTSTSGHTFASDDAFITYRYAQNLFLGNGAYFNIGEKVEGYSNFLYLLLMLPGFLFNNDNIYIYSTIVNAILLYAVMFYFFITLTKYFNSTNALIGISLIGLNPAVWANVTTGLETMLVLFIFILLWYIVECPRNRRNIALLISISSLSMLARVDGFIFPLIVSVYLLLNREKKLGTYLIIYTFCFMVIYAMVRYYYYDDIIANTYYAKVSGNLFQRISSGLSYLYEQTIFNGIAFYSIFVVFFFIKTLLANRKQLVTFPFIFLFIWTSYLIYIGGDIYYERFLLPILLISIFYFITFINNKTTHIKVLLFSLALISSFSILYQDGRFAYQNKNYDMWENLGKFLKRSPADYTLAIDAAGKVPYYSQLKTIDMLGLNNKRIGKMQVNNGAFYAGHMKYDADYTLSLAPNLIAAGININKDLGWGITKKKYENNYILKYLINASRDNLQNNIYDVEYFDDVLIDILIRRNFIYAVLVRKDSVSKMPYLLSGKPLLFWYGRDLPSQTGTTTGLDRMAANGVDKPGYITFGPYTHLLEGRYQLDISYISSNSNNIIVGSWDAVMHLPTEIRPVEKGTIYGTNGLEQHIVKSFVVSKDFPNKRVGVRNFYNGIGNLTIKTLTITKTE